MPRVPGLVREDAVRDGHWAVVEWMASDPFRELKSLHDRALGEGRVYFRPVNGSIVRLALHPEAPKFVGFRTSREDEGFRLLPDQAMADEQELSQRREAFEAWLPSVRGGSREERAVIRLLSATLRNHLELPALPGWYLLHQEWRFLLDGTTRGRKSDILCIEGATGRLGIIECKSEETARGQATAQVQGYAAAWLRDAPMLASFFTELARVQARLYGAETLLDVTVPEEEARTFFGWPEGERLRVVPV